MINSNVLKASFATVLFICYTAQVDAQLAPQISGLYHFDHQSDCQITQNGRWIEMLIDVPGTANVMFSGEYGFITQSFADGSQTRRWGFEGYYNTNLINGQQIKGYSIIYPKVNGQLELHSWTIKNGTWTDYNTKMISRLELRNRYLAQYDAPQPFAQPKSQQDRSTRIVRANQTASANTKRVAANEDKFDLSSSELDIDLGL